VRAAASTIVGARAPLDAACAKIIGMTSALKLESFRKASRQNPNVSDVFSTSAVRSEGLATEPKSGTTSFSALAVGFERRQQHAMLLGLVGADHRRTARSREDSDAPAVRRRP